MKKEIIMLMMVITIFIFSGCADKGTITTEPHDFITINGKVYKLMAITPCKGCNSIWILYPKDSSDTMPQILNYDVKQGKTTVNETVIKVQ